MSETDEELRNRLSDLLNGIPVEWEGMTIGEPDGHVVALMVFLELVPLSEWHPGEWGGEGASADVAEAEADRRRGDGPLPPDRP